MKAGVSAGFLGVAGQGDCLLRGIRTGAGNDRHPPFGHLDAQIDDPLVLRMTKRRRLTGGAAGHQAVCPFIDLPFHQTLELGFANRSVFKRRDEGNVGTFEHGSVLSNCSISQNIAISLYSGK